MVSFGETNNNKKKKNTSEKVRKVDEDTLFKEAIKHHAKGDLENAEKHYREAISIG